MRILVIGRSGQVATALCERGAALAHDVIALGRPDVDLTRPASLREALGDANPDVVVNAAAYTAVDAAESDAETADALNAEAPGTLAELARAARVPFIHLSTDYVFDGTLQRPYREDDPIAPASVYGRTKAAGEANVLVAGGAALILRTAWVYAPFGRNFVRTMLRLGAERGHVRVVDDQRGNPTSALDIADAILALCADRERWRDRPDIVHLTATGEASWHEFAEAIFAWARADVRAEPITTAQFPTPASRPANSRLDCGKLADAYGIRLPHWRDSGRTVVERLVFGGEPTTG